MKKVYFWAFIAIAMSFCCCCNKQNKCFTDEDSTYLEVESLNFNEIDIQVKAGELSPTALDYVNLYRTFLNKESDCNKGKEPLIDFICNFISDATFQKERMKISDDMQERLSNFELTFKFMLDDDGTLCGWSQLDCTHAAYLAGWLDSEWMYCLSFERNGLDGQWYLTEFIELD